MLWLIHLHVYMVPPPMKLKDWAD